MTCRRAHNGKLSLTLFLSRLLEVSGKGEALKSARRELSARFARKRRVVEAEPA